MTDLQLYLLVAPFGLLAFCLLMALVTGWLGKHGW
jgi:hypothetical protein